MSKINTYNTTGPICPHCGHEHGGLRNAWGMEPDCEYGWECEGCAKWCHFNYEPEIKPCPFCGAGEPHVMVETSQGISVVTCGGCCGEGPNCGTPKEAIDQWNACSVRAHSDNRKPDRYALPPELGNRDTTMWVAGKPFFLASAIKYIWRGWDHADDLRKAVECLELAYVHEADLKADFPLMTYDLDRIDWRDGSREHALSQLTRMSFSIIGRVDIRRCIKWTEQRVRKLEGGEGESA